MDYQVKIENYAGPMDLLLFFIQRDKLNIYDIPIAQITKEFLDYMKMMEMMNIDLGGEFVYMASLLMRIKAKMLLPFSAALQAIGIGVGVPRFMTKQPHAFLTGPSLNLENDLKLQLAQALLTQIEWDKDGRDILRAKPFIADVHRWLKSQPSCHQFLVQLRHTRFHGGALNPKRKRVDAPLKQRIIIQQTPVGLSGHYHDKIFLGTPV